MPREVLVLGQSSGFEQIPAASPGPEVHRELGASWGWGFSDPSLGPPAARAAWGLPGRRGAQEMEPQVSQTSPNPSRAGRIFPFPPWLPLLLFSTCLPLFLFGFLVGFFFPSSISTTGRQGLAACVIPSHPLGWGVSLGSSPGTGTSPQGPAVLAAIWTFPAVCCCCGFHCIVLRCFFFFLAMLMGSLGVFFRNKPCWSQPGSLCSHSENLAAWCRL